MATVPQVEYDIAYLFKVEVIGDVHNQLTETGFHFSIRGAMMGEPPVSIGSALLTHFIGTVLPDFRLCCSEEWTARSVVCYSKIPKSEVLFEVPLTAGAGGQESVSLPSFNSICLRLRTGYGGRSRTGSIHIPGVARDLCVASRIEDSYAGRFRQMRDVLLSAYSVQGSSNSFVWGVYSKKLGDTQPGGPGNPIHHSLTGFYPIISAFVEEKVGSILKRKIGRGE